MMAQLATKAERVVTRSPEAENLQRLREEASKITRQVQLGKLTVEQATKELQELTARNVTFGYRVFGI